MNRSSFSLFPSVPVRANFGEQVVGKIMILPAMILPLVRSSVWLRLRRAVSSVVESRCDSAAASGV